MACTRVALSGSFCVTSAICVRSAKSVALCHLLISVLGDVRESLSLSAAVGVCIVDVQDVLCHKVVAREHGLEWSDKVDVLLLHSSDARERV